MGLPGAGRLSKNLNWRELGVGFGAPQCGPLAVDMPPARPSCPSPVSNLSSSSGGASFFSCETKWRRSPARVVGSW